MSRDHNAKLRQIRGIKDTDKNGKPKGVPIATVFDPEVQNFLAIFFGQKMALSSTSYSMIAALAIDEAKAAFFKARDVIALKYGKLETQGAGDQQQVVPVIPKAKRAQYDKEVQELADRSFINLERLSAQRFPGVEMTTRQRVKLDWLFKD